MFQAQANRSSLNNSQVKGNTNNLAPISVQKSPPANSTTGKSNLLHFDNDAQSPDRVSQGSQLSAKLSASLRKTLENSAGR